MRILAMALVVGVASACAMGQADNPDFRVRAEWRTPDNGQWGADTSAGHADFRVVSRYGQVYYGGVIRQDEFRFAVRVDFTELDGFAQNFAASPYDTNYDVYIENGFVGRAIMGLQDVGVAELTYDSRHPSPPALPLPSAWPSPVDAGDVVRVYFAAPAVPAIGSPLPSGAPVFESPLGEEFLRGDANQDGEVDASDFAVLAANYDPFGMNGVHVGPMAGDFTGDNASTSLDYAVLVQNWTASSQAPAEPLPCIGVPSAPASVTSCRGGSASFGVTAVGTGNFSYQWRKNGVNISNAANPTARDATLTISNIDAANAGSYTCLVTTDCGSALSAQAQLTVCLADLDDGTGLGGCNGAVDIDDLLFFLGGFEQGSTAVDLDNGQGFGVRDGGVDINDLLFFLVRFEQGC